MLAGLLAAVVGLDVVLRFLPVDDGRRLLPVNDENPVARFERQRDFTASVGWNFAVRAEKHSNNYGFLNDQDYDRHATSPLLAVIGDSYVQADQVENAQALYGRLARRVGAAGRVYSFGASGSPLSSYLGYAQYVRDEFKPDAAVFIIIGNDFDESLRKYKSTSGHYFFAPGVDGELVLERIDYEPKRIRTLARHSALVRYLAFNVQVGGLTLDSMLFRRRNDALVQYVGNTPALAVEERVEDSKRAVDAFLHEVTQRVGLTADRVLFVVDGMRPHLYSESGMEIATGSFADVLRNYFMQRARTAGHEVIDLQPVFTRVHQDTGVRFEHEIDAHWNAHGHRIAAEQIASSEVFARTFSER